jgi:AbrB family looped-hinge helix DNA binding protein
MPTATRTSKGQVTIPQAVREAMGLRTGVQVDFTPNPDGTCQMRVRSGSLKDLFGILGRHDGPPVSVEEMNEAIAQAVTEDYERIRNQNSPKQ